MRPTPIAWLGCIGRDTSPTPSGAPSPSLTSAGRRAVWAMHCAPTSRRCNERSTGRPGASGNRRHVRRNELNCSGSATTCRRAADWCCEAGVGRAHRLPQNPHRWRVAMARIRVSKETRGALELLGRGGAALRQRLLPQRADRSRRCGRGCGRPGGVAQALDWVREQRPVGRRRTELPAGVRAHHPCQGADRPVRGRAGHDRAGHGRAGHRRAGRGIAAPGDPAVGAPSASSRGREQDRQPDRDPGAAGRLPPDAR